MFILILCQAVFGATVADNVYKQLDINCIMCSEQQIVINGIVTKKEILIDGSYEFVKLNLINKGKQPIAANLSVQYNISDKFGVNLSSSLLEKDIEKEILMNFICNKLNTTHEIAFNMDNQESTQSLKINLKKECGQVNSSAIKMVYNNELNQTIVIDQLNQKPIIMKDQNLEITLTTEAAQSLVLNSNLKLTSNKTTADQFIKSSNIKMPETLLSHEDQITVNVQLICLEKTNTSIEYELTLNSDILDKPITLQIHKQCQVVQKELTNFTEFPIVLSTHIGSKDIYLAKVKPEYEVNSKNPKIIKDYEDGFAIFITLLPKDDSRQQFIDSLIIKSIQIIPQNNRQLKVKHINKNMNEQFHWGRPYEILLAFHCLEKGLSKISASIEFHYLQDQSQMINFEFAKECTHVQQQPPGPSSEIVDSFIYYFVCKNLCLLIETDAMTISQCMSIQQSSSSVQQILSEVGKALVEFNIKFILGKGTKLTSYFKKLELIQPANLKPQLFPDKDLDITSLRSQKPGFFIF